jgi:hypothetical protein
MSLFEFKHLNTRLRQKRRFFFSYRQFSFFWMMTFPSYGLYISHLVRFPRICNNVFDINDRNLIITEKLLHQGYHFHQLLKTFTKLYYRYADLAYKYNYTCRNMIKKDIYHKKIWPVKPLINLIRIGYDF